MINLNRYNEVQKDCNYKQAIPKPVAYSRPS